MPTDTREAALETLIVDHLVTQNGYERGASADYTIEIFDIETQLCYIIYVRQCCRKHVGRFIENR
jgi:hypothetical protein